MASRGSKLSAAVLVLVAAGASAPAILEQFLKEEEGFALRAYQDGAKIWTDCNGRAHHGGRPARDATEAECAEWLQSEIGRRFRFIDRTVRVQLSEPARAGVTSFCFNVGNAACGSSTALRLINQGQQAAGCDAMLRFRYITRNGRKIDCSTEQPYCKGLWDRRQAERELCLL